MSSELIWHLKRFIHLIRRASGSVAQRGWRGTFDRLRQERSRLRTTLLSASASAAGRSAVILPSSPVFTNGEAQKRILIIDSMTPDPERDSGSVRLCHIFDLLHRDGWRIDFLADDGFATGADIARLTALGVTVQQTSPPSWLRREGAALDAVMLCRLPVADQYLPLVRRHCSSALLIFDTVDLHFIREQRAAQLNHSRRLQRRARRSRRRELNAIAHSDVALVVSPQEQAVLTIELPSSRVELLTNIHPLHPCSAGFRERKDLLFIGGFGHPPNADAMRWFAADVLPLLRGAEPAMQLHIIGDIDAQARSELQREGIRVHGRVADLAPFMQACRISIAPLRFGAGVKGKVNMAMSYGLPVAVTSIAAEGMHLIDRENAMIADTPAGLAAAILELYHDETLWTKLSAGALANVREHFSVEQARHTLRRVLAMPASQRGTSA